MKYFKALNLYKPNSNFLTANYVLQRQQQESPEEHPGHWTIRPTRNTFINDPRGVLKINNVAHRQARDGYNFHNVGACISTCAGVRHDKASCSVYC